MFIKRTNSFLSSLVKSSSVLIVVAIFMVVIGPVGLADGGDPAAPGYQGRPVKTRSFMALAAHFQEEASIPTNGASDWQFFTIGGDSYLVVANVDNDSTYNIDSKIYRWNGTGFVEFQSIPTNGAADWEFFTIGSDSYLAVANSYNDSTYNVDSKIYQWNGASFVETQSIPTNGALDWEFFTIGSDSYLAVANQYNGSTFNVDSKIYQWNGASFTEFQSFPTNGASDWGFFTIGSDSYLALANVWNDSTYNMDSKIYQWNGASFVEFQSIPTNGALDWEFFTIGSDSYLAVAHRHNDSTFNIDSKIYRWNGTSFAEFQSIPTSGATDWEFFTIGSDSYLALVNNHNDSTHNIDSKIYQWNGTNFTEFQSIPTSGANDWEFFTISSAPYLAVANYYNGSTRNIDSKIYKLESINLAISGGVEVYPGDAVSVALTVEGANDLYGLQATCTVDPAILAPQNGVFGDFFDNPLVGANAVDAGAGTWFGGLSLRNPADPLSGDGLFATLNYEALIPGTTPITCDPLASDQDGFELPIFASGDSLTVLAFGSISSTATYQGRLDHAGIEVTATGPANGSASTDSAGQFEVGQLKAGSYDVRADAALYLPSCITTTVANGQTTALTATVLAGGDTNDNDKIKIGDATLIGSNFGQTPPADSRADINADGTVNVQDLAILGGNFGLKGCQAW